MKFKEGDPAIQEVDENSQRVPLLHEKLMEIDKRSLGRTERCQILMEGFPLHGKLTEDDGRSTSHMKFDGV